MPFLDQDMRLKTGMKRLIPRKRQAGYVYVGGYVTHIGDQCEPLMRENDGYYNNTIKSVVTEAINCYYYSNFLA